MILPTGWSIKSLEEVATVHTGIAKSSRKLKDPLDLPYLRVANVQDGFLDLDVMRTMSIERAQLARYALQIGDVLMTEGGDADKLGRGDVWRGQISPCIHQNHIFAVRPNQTLILPEFLSALAASRYGRQYFFNCAKRSTNLASINSNQVKQFPIILPPLAQQKTIVSLLNSWNKALAASYALIQNSEAQKSLLHTQLLTPEASEIHQAWAHVKLAEIVGLDRESVTIHTPREQVFRYIAGKSVQAGAIFSPLPRYSLREAPTRARRIVRNGDLLMSMVRPQLQGFARVEAEHDGCLASTSFAVMTPTNAVSRDFLFHYLHSPAILHQIQRVEAGTNYPQITIHDVAALEIRLPKLDVQEAIADMLNAADLRIALERKASQLLQEQKMDLFEQMLQGRHVPQ